MPTPSEPPIRIYIVEDVKLLRLDMVYALGAMEGIEVVGSAGSAEDALKELPTMSAEVVLMDIGLPGINGIVASQRLNEQIPNLRVIMLTAHDDEEEVFSSLKSGASAYCVKGIYVDRLVDVIRSVHEGASWLDPKVAQVVMNVFKSPTSAPAAQHIRSQLSDQELQALELIAQGKEASVIADELHSSLTIIKHLVSNILNKMNVSDVSQAGEMMMQTRHTS